jgi:hypothetical protein
VPDSLVAILSTDFTSKSFEVRVLDSFDPKVHPPGSSPHLPAGLNVRLSIPGETSASGSTDNMQAIEDLRISASHALHTRFSLARLSLIENADLAEVKGRNPVPTSASKMLPSEGSAFTFICSFAD